MNIDELVAAADPAREREFAGGSVNDARRLIDDRAPKVMETHERAWWRRGFRARSPNQRWRRSAASASRIAVPLGGIVVAVLVAGVAGLIAHGNHHSAASTGQQGAALRQHRAGLPPVAELGPDVRIDRALIGEFGLLRQPQTTAARTFNTGPKLGARIALLSPFVPSLTRAIQLPHRETLYLYVEQRYAVGYSGGGRNMRPAGLCTFLRAPFQANGRGCQSPQRLSRPVGPEAEPYTLSQKHWLYVELVPDQVASVRWTFRAAPNNAGVYPSTRGRTGTVPIHHNIAVFALGNLGSPLTDTWYDARGQVIGRDRPCDGCDQ